MQVPSGVHSQQSSPGTPANELIPLTPRDVGQDPFDAVSESPRIRQELTALRETLKGSEHDASSPENLHLQKLDELMR